MKPFTVTTMAATIPARSAAESSILNPNEVTVTNTSTYQKEWRERNPDKARAIQQRAYYKDVEKSREYNRRKAQERRAANPEENRRKAAAWREKNREKRRAYDREYRAANQDRFKKKDREQYAKHREKKLARSRVFFQNNAELMRARKRRSNGIPEPTRPRPQVCECCGAPPSYRGLHADHCHVTNTFRGWLCGKCNRGIGLLGDGLDIVLKAAEYLKRSSS